MLGDHLGKVFYFRAVCEAGSFRAAAERLRLSQSSLTVAVRKLEESIDEVLLVRSKRGVLPTAAGELVLAFARDMEHRIDDLQARLRAPPGAAAGHVRLGSYDSIAVYWLPQALRSLAADLPNVSLSIQVGTSTALLEKVALGSVDIALVVAPRADPRLVKHELFRDQFHVYATRTGRRGPLIAMLAARIGEGLTLAESLRSHGVPTEGILDVESFEIAKSLALQDVGPAVLPTRVAEVTTGRARLARVPGFPAAFGSHTIGLVMQKDANLRSPLAVIVAKALRKLA